jgi:mercuric ion transport protein
MTSQAGNEGRLAQHRAGGSSARYAQALLTFGGVSAALAASSCCSEPLVLFALGVSGAWIANLTRLAPYQPLFIAATAACLGAGYWLAYRARKVACANDETCVRPLPRLLVKVGLAVASILAGGALAFAFLAPLFL